VIFVGFGRLTIVEYGAHKDLVRSVESTFVRAIFTPFKFPRISASFSQ
jgi:hypothetical protein